MPDPHVIDLEDNQVTAAFLNDINNAAPDAAIFRLELPKAVGAFWQFGPYVKPFMLEQDMVDVFKQNLGRPI